MPRDPSHPIAFAAAEAMAAGAEVALIAWEVNGEVHWRTTPGHQSAVIMQGMLSILAAPDAEPDEDDSNL
jgi:hypothetical protein